MSEAALSRRLTAEAVGTALLLATVVGSGIMAERLAGGNDGLALLCNAIATGANLVVLILVFAPVSGAHFNPVVTLAFAIKGEVALRIAALYIACQFAGALVGVGLAHAMFDLSVLQVSGKVRAGWGQYLSEIVATGGLLLAILGTRARSVQTTAFAIGLYIAAAYFFTASTSFANPAVTLARAFTDTFAGIAPSGVVPFMLAEIVGLGAALALAGWLGMRGGVRGEV